jgi:hypothetical protein
MASETIYTPDYATIRQFGARTGMSRWAIYTELSNGNLRAVKRGKSTLIDVQHALAWLASLPPAKIRMAPRRVA